ncbi:LysR family transcriptional regulator [Rahnella aquatilis]|jgi:DNA-binding transcriptional LysR family regulator|uniref:LysR family transcriptional regulator n=1 Tax=Rahnella sp. (strain Y9602) TaxID=2703885 RepID=UPI000256B68F|nr:LysR family transcriptional regulator [Rahnella aceris]AFE58622.1 LysR family transcriptional regulator [Rahnella aquatilis HX2]AZP42475.1 LysR family transcriptional regulator [Rahnella aquatilis]AZP46815.1 LysR family transcriptional regulator [Rahnella aquatilis]MBU9866309.1 LysR family transcriptional regulator [Rahnella aceris]RKT80462.1 DNA-binding transcriptional LysR family regulator [Rahnella aquatilis]
MQTEDLRIFIAVVKAGSFTTAAEQLMLSKQYVSRRMASLEAGLHARLLNRNTRKLSVTESGQLFAQHAQRILDDIEEAERAVSPRRQALQGTYRISIPMSFGISHLSPLIAEFLGQHPAIQFQVELVDRYVDLVGEGFDIALRIGNLADSSLVARRLGELKRVICCSPEYLQRKGTPETPEDLLNHHCLRYGREGQTGWELELEGKRRLFDVRGPIVSNNGEVLRDAAVAGLGLVLLPEFIVGPALQYGALVRVLDAFHPGALSLHAIYPQHRQRSEVTRVFLDFLQERLKAQLLVSA